MSQLRIAIQLTYFTQGMAAAGSAFLLWLWLVVLAKSEGVG